MKNEHRSRWQNRFWILLMFALLPIGVHAATTEKPLPEAIVRQVTDIMLKVDEDPQVAIERLQVLLERRTRAPRVQAYIVQQLAALQIREQQLEAAQHRLIDVLNEKDPAFALPLRLMLGQALLMSEDYTAGLKHLEIWAQHSKPPEPTGLFLLGYGYLRTEQLDLAIARLEDAMASVDETPRNHWIELLAYAYARAGRADEAYELMKTLLTRDPSQERWWRQLAGVLLMMDSIPRGTAALALAEVVKPGSYVQQKRLARFLAHLGLPYEGARVLEDAILEAANEVDGAAQQVSASSTSGNSVSPADGEEQVDEDGQPAQDSRAEDQMLLAQMWVLAREFDKAVDAFHQAESLDQADGKPALILGQMYLHWERYDDAQQALQRSVDIYAEATPAQVYYLLAIAQINLKLYGQALISVEQLQTDQAYATKGQALAKFVASRQALLSASE